MTAEATEESLRESQRGAGGLALFLLALLAATAQELYTIWLNAPADLTATLATSFSLLFGVGLVWCAAWAALSRVFRKQWFFLIHCSIYLGVGAVFRTYSDIHALAWFSLDLPGNWYVSIGDAAVILMVVLMVYLHARVALGRLSLLQTLGFILIPAGLLLLMNWYYDRAASKNVNHIEANSRIYPPAFRLHEAMPLEDFFSTGHQLKGSADKARDDLPASDEET